MHHLLYGIFYLLSLLPMPVLYLFSEVAFFFVYRVMQYRQEVVLKNLEIAFPEKTIHEKKLIAKKFYRNFTDQFIETIKLFSASKGFIRKHFNGDFSLINELNEKHHRVQLHSGHFFNWEYANLGIPLHLQQKLLTVYMPLTNKTFENIFKKMRSRTGAVLLPATTVSKAIIPQRNTRGVLALVADQSPGDPRNARWFPFFSKPAPFLKAPETGARRGNIPVVFCHFSKVKRGYYKIHFALGSENPAALTEGELTKKYADYLMDAIRNQPESYLWSHRRWKWADKFEEESSRKDAKNTI